MKALFLYTELSGYFLSCVQQLSQKEIDIQVIHWPINNDAPFLFSTDKSINLKQKNIFKSFEELEQDCLSFDPDIIYVSGWMDKQYLKLCSRFRDRNKLVILAFDNQWKGTAKQYLGIIWSKIFLRKKFSHVWIPGVYQYILARKLGFNESQIRFGLYSCDQKRFSDAYQSTLKQKHENYPRNFIFTGRLSKEKGILELYEIFSNLTDDERNGWKLIIIGTGPLKDLITSNKNIDVRGFIQPQELQNIISEVGCHVFPSKIEPWGVAVHEFCSAGLPLLISNSSGASTAFLRIGINGYSINGKDLSDLKQNLLKITRMKTSDLLEFGKNSNKLSFQITPNIWAETFVNIHNN